MYAVIKTGGKQYRVAEGSFSNTKLNPTTVNARATVSRLLK